MAKESKIICRMRLTILALLLMVIGLTVKYYRLPGYLGGLIIAGILPGGHLLVTQLFPSITQQLRHTPLLINTGIMPCSLLVPLSYTHLRAHETPEHLVC